LRRRFYQSVAIAGGRDGFALALDGRPVRTPARRPLAAPNPSLADALADEWRAQADVIDPARMPLTRLANSIIDGVADTPSAVRAEIEKYLRTDLLFYRADNPARLVAKQTAAWDPLLTWADEALGARFELTQRLTFVSQPASAIAAASGAIPQDAADGAHIWRLGALHSVTTLTGSALIALALLHGRVAIAEAWAAAHVDEDWNMEQWGQDELALQRRAFRFEDMQAAGRVLTLLQS
jgi:chaperone required for assembly of F1-ATPase